MRRSLELDLRSLLSVLLILTNYIIKYPNDSSLLVPAKYDIDLSEELWNVLKWAEHNKMQVNMIKTKEIVFTGWMPEMSYFLLNCLALKESYVPSCLVFGCRQIWAWGSMLITFCTYVTSERTCSHNLKGKDYHRRNYKVFLMQSLAWVLYASSTWRGYLRAANIDSLHTYLLKQNDGKLS